MLGDAAPRAILALVAALDAERAIVVGNGPTASVEMVPDHGERIKAANALLDRRYGKPNQAITGEDGGPLQVDGDLFGIISALAARLPK